MQLSPIVPFHQAGRSMRNCEDCAQCAFCDRPLYAGHEHDHFPIPHRHGGTDVVGTCKDCHTLKDRIPLHLWPLSAATKLLADLVSSAGSPEIRIYVAVLVTATLDAERTKDDWKAKATAYEAQLVALGVDPVHVETAPGPPVPKFGKAA